MPNNIVNLKYAKENIDFDNRTFNIQENEFEKIQYYIEALNIDFMQKETYRSLYFHLLRMHMAIRNICKINSKIKTWILIWLDSIVEELENKD